MEARIAVTVNASLGDLEGRLRSVDRDALPALAAVVDGEGGSIELRAAPAGQGTELHVVVRASAPGGPIGGVVAKVLGREPAQRVRDDLRRFKQLVETGEIARSDAAPDGVRTANITHQEDARPPDGGGDPRTEVDRPEVRS